MLKQNIPCFLTGILKLGGNWFANCDGSSRISVVFQGCKALRTQVESLDIEQTVRVWCCQINPSYNIYGKEMFASVSVSLRVWVILIIYLRNIWSMTIHNSAGKKNITLNIITELRIAVLENVAELKIVRLLNAADL